MRINLNKINFYNIRFLNLFLIKKFAQKIIRIEWSAKENESFLFSFATHPINRSNFCTINKKNNIGHYIWYYMHIFWSDIFKEKV